MEAAECIDIHYNNFSEIETPFGKRILIKKRKIKEQMKIILSLQYFEIFQISSSGKIFTKNIMELKEIGISLNQNYFLAR